MRTLNAWIGERNVGVFTESPRRDGTFDYAFEYSSASEADIVSLTMVPSADELRFESRIFPPTFDMILPEGDRRARIEEARKILRSDPFSLLSYVGGNPVNRVRFLAPGADVNESPPEMPTPKEIAGTRSGRELFRELLNATDLRQGVAGVQPKILGAASKGKLSPEYRQFRGSTHLLKASTDRFPFLAANESACLNVFARAGVQVPRTTLSADGELLLVERFDLRKDGTLTGFEEAAALLGETSASKFDRDYGTMIEVLCEFLSPPQQTAARATLIKCLVLNHLLGNGDAHLKNFGVLYDDAWNVWLAPAYDCVATLPYLKNDVPALSLSFEWYSKAWWPRAKVEEFAQQYGLLPGSQIRHIVNECSAAVLQGADAVLKMGRDIGGFASLASRISSLWRERVESFNQEASAIR